MFIFLRTCDRPFFENVLRNKNAPPTVFRMPASYKRGTPVPLYVERLSRLASAHVGKILFKSNPMQNFNLQGYLAHEKTPTPLGPPWDPRQIPTVGS